MRLVAAAVVLLGSSCMCGQQCAALCIHEYTLDFVDEQDGGVAPGAGRIAFGATTTSFDCSSGAAPARLACFPNALRIESRPELGEVTLNITEQGGTRGFIGIVPLLISDPNRVVCGQHCPGGYATVTMQ